MTALDGELGKFFDNGDELELGNGWNAMRPLKATRNPVTESIDISMSYLPGTLTPYVISAGGAIALTTTAADVMVDNAAAAATDDLDTITPHADQGPGAVVIVRSTNASRDPTLRHNVGNLKLAGAANFTLTATKSRIALMWSGSYWRELWRET